MNRPQLPIEVKEVVCQQVLAGWKVDAAAKVTGFSAQSIGRWLTRYKEGGVKALRSRRGKPVRKEVKQLSRVERRAVDQVLSQHPYLRCRSLQEYLLRHHQLKVSRRQLDRYLRSRGLVEPAAKQVEEGPPRRFEALEPMAMLQIDVMYVAKTGGGYFYVADVIDDHSRFMLASVALEEQTDENVLGVLRRVVSRWGVPHSVLTDRGISSIQALGLTHAFPLTRLSRPTTIGAT